MTTIVRAGRCSFFHASQAHGKGGVTASNQLPLLYKPDVLAMIRTFVVDPKASVMGPEGPEMGPEMEVSNFRIGFQ